jgi:hypothetical protein
MGRGVSFPARERGPRRSPRVRRGARAPQEARAQPLVATVFPPGTAVAIRRRNHTARPVSGPLEVT